ncbi:MAG: HNH endonuclease [Bacteroidetes bacterium]|nr:MAG: HNH endonuclease [Bacteroidota bacterium]
MREPISEEIRQMVASRARYCCEYCLLPERFAYIPFQMDHVIAVKHGGATTIENLALACPHCNQHKGSDIASYLPESGEIVPLFNPRRDAWEQHFKVVEGTITGLSTRGRQRFACFGQLLTQARVYP